MGCADFYLNIYSDNNLVIKICEKLSYYDKFNVFNYLKNENKIEIEGYFDNFLITNKILFSVLSSFNIAQDKIVIETMKKNKNFNFNSELEMFNWLFNIYETKMNGYFKDYGFLSIPAKNIIKDELNKKNITKS